jgi:hypothetical protein
MSPPYSKKELALLGGVGIYIFATLGMLIWMAVKLGSALVLLGVFYSPLLWVGVLSLVLLLLRRSEAAAWSSLAFFGLQGVKVEHGGSLVWPPGTSVGIHFELVQNATHVLELGISSIVLAIVSAAVILQHIEEKVLPAKTEVAPLLPPNKSLERTREG